MIAEPMPAPMMQSTSGQMDVTLPAIEMPVTVSVTAIGSTHQRPYLSVYAPNSGCTIELVTYQRKTSAP